MKNETDGVTAKEYLKQVQRKEAIIKRLCYDRENLRNMLYSFGMAGEGEKVQTSRNNDRMGSIYIKIEEKDSRITKMMEELIEFKVRVAEEISMLSDPKYIEVLHKRYIQFQRFEQIAVDLNYSYRYVVKIHGYALVEFEKKILKR